MTYRKIHQDTPVGGGLGQPGQRVSRYESLREELKRILNTTGGMLLFSIVILLSVINILAILGPWFGWGIGVCAIVCAFVFLRAWMHRTAELDIWFEIGFVVLLVLILALWGMRGYEWVESWWLPPCHLGFWWELILVCFHLAAIYILAFGTWGFWAELVDPNGPTAPRAATHRETLIKPWDTETYGGRYFEDPEEGPSLPAIETIALDVTEDGETGRKNHTFVPSLPAHAAFRQFCKHVVQGHVTFTEENARAYDVALDDVKDQGGNVLMWGMRTFRAFALHPSRKWIVWKNPRVHARGLILSDKFIKILAAIAGISLPAQE